MPPLKRPARRRGHNRQSPEGFRRTSSHRWLRTQLNDPYTLGAKEQGWRARSVYKLDYIQQRANLLQPGNRVLDLGAAPGSWSQLAKQIVKLHGKVIAVDITPITNIEGVTAIVADVYEPDIAERLIEIAQGKYHVVLSDMAPPASGSNSADNARHLNLSDAAVEVCTSVLTEGGNLCIKLFDGAGTDEWISELALKFHTTKRYKPPATKSSSREFFLVGKGFMQK